MTSHYDQMDYVVMAAAVSDYRVKYPHDQKIKKVAGQTDWQLDLVANPDILAQLGQTKRPASPDRLCGGNPEFARTCPS